MTTRALGGRWVVFGALAFAAAMAASLPARAEAPATNPAGYQEPDLKKAIFGEGQLTLPAADRVAVAQVLVKWVREGLTYRQPQDYATASHFLGLAFRLDPGNRGAVIANALLKAGQSPAPDSPGSPASPAACATDLMNDAGKCIALNSHPDWMLAAYLYEAIESIAPGNDPARLGAEQLKKAGVAADWAFADAPHALVPASPAPALAPVIPATNPTGNTAIAPPAVPPSALPINPAGYATPLRRVQCTINALALAEDRAGFYHGKMMPIICTAYRADDAAASITARTAYLPNTDPAASQRVDASLDGAARLVQLRRPDTHGLVFDMTFDQKAFKTRDASSAGAAYAVAMLALVDNFQLDPAAAALGEVGIDGKIKGSGYFSQIGVRVRGGADDGCQVVAVPDSDGDQVTDAVVRCGPDLLWSAQIFSVASLDDAVDVLRRDRPANLARAMNLFEQFRARYARQPLSALSQPEAVDALHEILTLAPNHLSAAHLERIARGVEPHRLSLWGSVAESLAAVRPVGRTDLNGWGVVTPDNLGLIRGQLLKIQKISDPGASPLILTLYDFLNAVDRMAADGDPQHDAVRRLYDEKRKLVRASVTKILMDNGAFDKLMDAD